VPLQQVVDRQSRRFEQFLCAPRDNDLAQGQIHSLGSPVAPISALKAGARFRIFTRLLKICKDFCGNFCINWYGA
jgi:hypothetical protein